MTTPDANPSKEADASDNDNEAFEEADTKENDDDASKEADTFENNRCWWWQIQLTTAKIRVLSSDHGDNGVVSLLSF